ncbi:MAG TPA: DUF1592 domain-containing protein [Polyangiaceae bacterium]|nr:DUF1592 domain-containing protein [Polyangiaceae bacterium]
MRLRGTSPSTWGLGCGLLLSALVGCSAEMEPSGVDGGSGTAGTSSPVPGAGAGGAAAGAPASGGTAGTPTAAGGSGSGAAPGAGSGGVAPGECAPFEGVSRRIWRLSNLQYSNVIRDLLGIASPPEVTGGGTALLAFYSKETETVDERLQFSYYQAAEAVAAQINPTTLAACTNGEAEQACAQRLATTLATKGFRRPVAAAEIADLMAVYAEGRKTDFASGIKLLVQAVLLAPSFAYRSELGEGSAAQVTLTPYEVASQLSFLFLNSMPDDALRAAAADGSLGTEAGIAQQVDRLFAIKGAQLNIARVIVDWFGGREEGKGKDAGMFPEYTPEVQQDLVTATRLFVEDALWNGTRKMDDLLLSSRLFVNARTAPLLGFTLPAGTPAGQFAAVTAPAGQRAGMLTQPGIMAAKSNTDATSVVHRGKYILKDVLCGVTIPEPPEGLLDQPEIAAKLNMLKTEQERTDYRLSTGICVGCHQVIDPFGMMLEHIDPIGRYRTELLEGGPVKASWDMAFSPSLTGTINGAQEFAQGMVKDRLLSSCGTRKLASYALGREQPASCELERIHDRYLASSDQSVATLLREVILDRVMRVRAGGTP